MCYGHYLCILPPTPLKINTQEWSSPRVRGVYWHSPIILFSCLRTMWPRKSGRYRDPLSFRIRKINMGKNTYKTTLNLPQTEFPMKGKLITMEPAMRDHWESINIHEKIREARKESPKWILHDGPPYANGQVHIGTGQNKILKDFVVKLMGNVQTMSP